MAITANNISQAIRLAAPDLKGPTWFPLTDILGVALTTWARMNPSNLSLTGSTNGVIGAGTVQGKVFVPPRPLVVPNAAVLAGLLGPTTPSMARAIGMGVANAFSKNAKYRGTSAGVGAGADVSRVTHVNGPSLVAAISSVATARKFLGPAMPPIASALGMGLATLLMTGIGTGSVVGGGGPIPSTGTSISVVF